MNANAPLALTDSSLWLPSRTTTRKTPSPSAAPERCQRSPSASIKGRSERVHKSTLTRGYKLFLDFPRPHSDTRYTSRLSSSVAPFRTRVHGPGVSECNVRADDVPLRLHAPRRLYGPNAPCALRLHSRRLADPFFVCERERERETTFFNL